MHYCTKQLHCSPTVKDLSTGRIICQKTLHANEIGIWFFNSALVIHKTKSVQVIEYAASKVEKKFAISLHLCTRIFPRADQQRHAQLNHNKFLRFTCERNIL